MTNEEVIHKLEYFKKAYQTLIDEKVNSGKLVGNGVRGEWKAETPLDEIYKDMIKALDIAIKALEQQPSEDAISREAVIQIIENKLNPCTDMFKCLEMSEIKEDVEHLPSVTPQQARWIPCSERLPEDNIHVLCQFTLSGMGECYLAHGVFHVVGGLVMSCNEVIAWMPLPEPYKEESKIEQALACADQDTLMPAT